MKRVYIAGPMTGHPDYNHPAFHELAARLRALGYVVENPAENPSQEHHAQPWQHYMRLAIPQMLSCDMVVLLPGWSGSRGAYLEWTIAHGLDMPVRYALDIQQPPA